ncbi:MAG: hypothetical protein ACKVHE_22575 [Planctomycetales bacterium]
MSTSTNESTLQSVENDLSKISTGMARSARVTGVIGVILMAAMLGYFIFGFSEIEDLTKPENLVALAGEVVNSSLPEIRESVQSTVKDSAPDWAQALSDQAIGATPTIRKSLEDHILAQTEGVISNGVNLGEAEFRKILRENKSSFEDTLDELAEGEEFSEETMLIFLDAVNKELGRDMEDQAEEVLGTLIALNEKVQKLSSNTSLDKEEALERQTLMVIRRLQIQEQDAQILVTKKAQEDAAAAARAEAAQAELDSEDPDAPADAEDGEKPAEEEATKPADETPAKSDDSKE